MSKKDSITKDIHKIKKQYRKEKYMEYSTYEVIKEKIDELYEMYEKEGKKSNRDYIIRQNRLYGKFKLKCLESIESLGIGIIAGILSSLYIKISEASNFIIIFLIIWLVIVVIAIWLVGWIKFTEKTNKYADEIEKYEIDLIEKILKEKYNKSKNKVNKKGVGIINVAEDTIKINIQGCKSLKIKFKEQDFQK